MNEHVKLRAHHLDRFARYYLGGKLSRSYGEEFTRRVQELFDHIKRKEVKTVTLVNGLDDMCNVCIELTDRKKPKCERRDEISQDPSALLAMAKSQFDFEKPYSVDEFLEGVRRIGMSYSSEELQALIQKTYAEKSGEKRFPVSTF